MLRADLLTARSFYKTMWPYTHLLFNDVNPNEATVDMSGIDSVLQFRSVYPLPGVVVWGDRTRKESHVENKLLLISILYRKIREYIKTGILDLYGVSVLVKTIENQSHFDETLRKIAAAMRIECDVYNTMSALTQTDIRISHLTPEFFRCHIESTTNLVDRISKSVMHTAAHITYMTQILAMYTTGCDMIHYYLKTREPAATDVLIIRALSNALYFSRILTDVFWIKHHLVCYYMQTPPLAAWAANACSLIQVVNVTWGALPATTQPNPSPDRSKPTGKGEKLTR